MNNRRQQEFDLSIKNAVKSSADFIHRQAMEKKQAQQQPAVKSAIETIDGIEFVFTKISGR
jgi:hypothetical protein